MVIKSYSCFKMIVDKMLLKPVVSAVLCCLMVLQGKKGLNSFTSWETPQGSALSSQALWEIAPPEVTSPPWVALTQWLIYPRIEDCLLYATQTALKSPPPSALPQGRLRFPYITENFPSALSCSFPSCLPQVLIPRALPNKLHLCFSDYFRGNLTCPK